MADNPSFNILDSMHNETVLNYIPRWPLIVHVVTACLCLGASAFYHLFQVHSRRIHDLLAKIDYTGISVLIMGSVYPTVYYGFACEPVFWLRNMFLILITTASFATFIVTMLPFFNRPIWRPFRGAMFILLGCCAAIPILYM